MSHNPAQARIRSIEIRPEMRIKPLDDEDLAQIHQATVTILEETGVRFPSGRALTVFAEAGAQVDFKSQNVRISSDLLMNCLSRAPRAFTMASRGSQDLDLCLDGTKTYCGTDGICTITVDLHTRKRRPSRKEDVAMMALISDYLSSVSFYWPLASANDTCPAVMSLHEIDASIANTEKHVHVASCAEGKTARYALEMARVIAGGSEEVRTRPPLSLFVVAVSPLSQHEGSLEAALHFAEAGLPVVFGTSPIVGLTAPASLSGTMVTGNSEILSGLCLLQLCHPGAPVCYCFFHDVINPLTGVTSTVKEPSLEAGMVQLGHYYNLPVMSSYGVTGAHTPGSWQTGKETAIDALFVCLTGPELVPSMGSSEATTVLYPEKILFDNDVYDSIKRITDGIRVDSKTLPIDEIMGVGPGGQFLDRDHTCENIRKLWHPGITHQWSHQQAGFRDPWDMAMDEVRWILENHKPAPLDGKIKAEMERIIKAAERELTG
jgi:trimethylamine--corrinoid protein Co-methyltransferase